MFGINPTGCGGVAAPVPTGIVGTGDLYNAYASNHHHDDKMRLLLQKEQKKSEALRRYPFDEETQDPTRSGAKVTGSERIVTQDNAGPVLNSTTARNYQNCVPFVLQDMYAEHAETEPVERRQRDENGITTKNVSYASGSNPRSSKDVSTASPLCSEHGCNTTSGGATSIMSNTTTSAPTHLPYTYQRRKRKKKPEAYPSRPLSAYNIFFREERINILKELKEEEEASKNVELSSSCGEKYGTSTVGSSTDNESMTGTRINKSASGVGFANLTKLIAGRWRELTPSKHEYFKKMATKDKDRYEREVVNYEKEEANKRKKEEETALLRIQEQQRQARIMQDERSRHVSTEHTSNNYGTVDEKGSSTQPLVDPTSFFQSTTGQGLYPLDEISNIEEQMFLNLIQEKVKLIGETANPQVFAILRELIFVEERISKLTRKLNDG